MAKHQPPLPAGNIPGIPYDYVNSDYYKANQGLFTQPARTEYRRNTMPRQNVLQGALQRNLGGGTQETYITMDQYNQWLSNMMSNYPAFDANNPWAQMFYQYALSGEPMIGAIKNPQASGDFPSGRFEGWGGRYKGRDIGTRSMNQPIITSNAYRAQRNPLQEAMRRMLGGM